MNPKKIQPKGERNIEFYIDGQHCGTISEETRIELNEYWSKEFRVVNTSNSIHVEELLK
jgi:hypothetical protein